MSQILFNGLPHFSIGAANLLPNGTSLNITGIGASGNDGVGVDLTTVSNSWHVVTSGATFNPNSALRFTTLSKDGLGRPRLTADSWLTSNTDGSLTIAVDSRMLQDVNRLTIYNGNDIVYDDPNFQPTVIGIIIVAIVVVAILGTSYKSTSTTTTTQNPDGSTTKTTTTSTEWDWSSPIKINLSGSLGDIFGTHVRLQGTKSFTDPNLDQVGTMQALHITGSGFGQINFDAEDYV